MVGGFLSVLAGLVAAVLCIAATGGPEPGSVSVAGVCLLVGFVGLSVTRTAEAPLRPMRLALGISIPVSAYMMFGLPWPPHGRELGSFIILAMGITLSAGAIVLGQRRPNVVFGILIILAAYGVFMLGRFGRALVSAPPAREYSGPAITIAFVLAATVGVAWIAALWHSRRLWHSARTLGTLGNGSVDISRVGSE